MSDAPESHPAPLSGHVASEPTGALFTTIAVALTAYVVGYPFTLATAPPLTDFPFHAAQIAIVRHYFDPAFHFREQFSFHPLSVPYVSFYALGALFSLVFSVGVASKLAAVVLLSLVPVGLATLFYGMNKSPLWGLSGLAFTWSTVTQWGFLNFMGAIGLFAMSVGYALLVCRRPTRARRVMLAVSLLAVFFTHVFRLPFALLSVLLAGALVYPATRTFSPLVLPLVPALALFVLWLGIRPPGLGISVHELGFHPERLREMGILLFGSYLPFDGAPMTPEGATEREIARRIVAVLAFAITLATVLFFTEGRARGRSERERAWGVGVTVLGLALAGGLMLGYLMLPYEAGNWFYVYPREVVAAAIFAASAAPDLPRGLLQRLGFSVLFAVAALPMTRFVSARFAEFEEATEDFRQILPLVPKAPRLYYLMFWLGGSAKRVSPFLHLPAWIQVERGGSLAFHFVQWHHTPIHYKEGGPDVPPPYAERTEWTPQFFDVKRDGAWFDTFLVRHRIDPHELFDADPSIHLTARRGTWWLYRRSR
ncbi:MAG TPA: hypothetical protein VHE30_25555 [Polyangiaceae bacterium]|nr:hypothetical protein [Polyangiaceae bacterium]